MYDGDSFSVEVNLLSDVGFVQIEQVMKLSLQEVMSEAVTAYPQSPRTEWVLSWPGQVVLASSIIYWTKEVTQVGREKLTCY